MEYENALNRVLRKHNELWRELFTWSIAGSSNSNGTGADNARTCDIYAFKPTRNISFLIRLARSVYLFLLKLKYPHFSIGTVSGIDQLKALRTNRVILCPNHPTEMDTDMAFLLAVILQEELYFLAAREVFMGSFINKYLLQIFGCFSVLRGFNDYNSFKHSVRLMQNGLHKLVIFPEGEVSGRNDMLLPLKPGPAHIACTVLDRLHKSGSDETVYIVPIALRYTYPGASARDLEAAMRSIEKALGIQASSHDLSLYDRMVRAGENILNELLAKYGDKQEPADTFYARVQSAREAILRAIAAYLGYEPECGLEETELIHLLFLQLYEARWNEEQLAEKLDFASHNDRFLLLSELLRDLHRVSRFISIGDHSLGRDKDDEINALRLLSDEVLGGHGPYLRVQLSIAFGDPIDVATIYDGDRKQKLQSILKVTEKMRRELEKVLGKPREAVT